jgi:hypothetical protein
MAARRTIRAADPPASTGARLRIAGLVRYGDAPQAGAHLTLVKVPPSDLLGTMRTTTSDGDGHFSLDVDERTGYVLTASLDGTLSDTVSVELRDPTIVPGAEEQVLTLRSCEIEVTGRITDQDGRALTNARVRRLAPGHQFLQLDGDTALARDGHYRICIDRGREMLRFAADGFATRIETLTTDHSVVRDVALGREGVVRGQVVSTDDGTPIAGVEVNLSSSTPARASVMILATTDEDGRFEAHGLPEGHIRVQVWGTHVLLWKPAELELGAGETGSITISVEPASVVSGVVTENGVPVTGAHIGTVKPGAAFHTYTDADGRFTLVGIQRDPDQRLDVRGYDVLDGADVDTTSPDVDGVHIEVAARPAIHGRVIADSQSLANAFVRPCLAVMYQTSNAVTRSDGSFEFPAAPGVYCLVATSATFDGVTEPQWGTLSDASVDVTLSFDGLGVLEGRVVGPHDAAIADAAVQAARRDGEAQLGATTRADGSFTIDHVASGEYEISVTAGDRVAKTSVTIAHGEHAQLPAILMAGAR